MKPQADFLNIDLRLRLNRKRQDRFRQPEGWIHHQVVLIGYRIAGLGILEFPDGADIAGADLRYLRVLLAEDREQVSPFFLDRSSGVVKRRVGFQCAGENPGIGQPSHERIDDGLEHIGRQRLGRRGDACGRFSRARMGPN